MNRLNNMNKFSGPPQAYPQTYPQGPSQSPPKGPPQGPPMTPQSPRSVTEKLPTPTPMQTSVFQGVPPQVQTPYPDFTRSYMINSVKPRNDDSGGSATESDSGSEGSLEESVVSPKKKHRKQKKSRKHKRRLTTNSLVESVKPEVKTVNISPNHNFDSHIEDSPTNSNLQSMYNSTLTQSVRGGRERRHRSGRSRHRRHQ